MGLEQGGSPCTEQALVSNFLSHFVKWTCEPVAKPRLQRRTPHGQIAGSCLTQLCWASPHSFPVRSQLHLFTSEKLPRAGPGGLGFPLLAGFNQPHGCCL